MRLFTAVELPENVRAHLARVGDSLREHPALKDLSWTKPQNLHITLKFFGDIPDDRVPALEKALARLTVVEMSFVPSHFLVLPGQGPARVLAVNVAGDVEALGKLFSQIESAVQPLGVSREARAYKPHITLARVRRPTRQLTAKTLAKLVDPGSLPAPAFAVSEFMLYRSELNPKGAVYSAVATIGSS